jgi:hypothetical protein
MREEVLRDRKVPASEGAIERWVAWPVLITEDSTLADEEAVAK